MKRSRSIPWIHRWSRYLMAGVVSVDATITGYLAIVKLTGSTACPTNGCDLVRFLIQSPLFFYKRIL